MVRAVFSVQQSLVSSQENGLVGLNDLQLVQTAGGTVLYAAARGGGYVTGFDVGTTPGQTSEGGYWEIGSQYLQLETTDLVVRDTASGPQMYMAGFAGNGLRGLNLDDDGQGPMFESQVAVSASNGMSLSLITEMELFDGSSSGLAAVRSGGLVNVSFGNGSNLNVSQVNEGPGLNNAHASDIITTTHNGQTYAFVSYGSEDTVAMYEQLGNGAMSFVASLDAGDGLWADRPGDLTVTTAADGGLYVVVAGSGSSSLSVLSVNAGGMTPVDHVLDGLDTRFEDANHITSVTISGQDYVLAAGADSGLSLFVVLPGGRLQHVESFEATNDAPLNGITGLEAMAVPGGIRVWASTESAPYLSEFSVSLQSVGTVEIAGNSGGTTSGTGNDDVLAGGGGADNLVGGNGDDVLMDGLGVDTMRGGSGSDTFILTQDDARDVIFDFQHQSDVIDLSSFGTLGGASDITIISQNWGAELRFGDEVLEVRSSNGTSLNASHFNDANLVIGGRVEVDTSLYPEVGNYVPEPIPNPVTPPPPPPATPAPPSPPTNPPNTGGGSVEATQLPGAAPVYNGWQASPGFTLNIDSASSMGTAASNMIVTFGASDYIFGMFGHDSINSGNGNDSVSGDGGNDFINSGAGHDVVMGGTGFDTILSGDGNDTVAGGDGADSIQSGNGNDMVLGGLGYDQIYGGGGNDSIWGGATADRLYGGGGNDFISAGSNFSITVDGVWGEAGDDTIYGDGGYDYLDGGTGNDVIDGGDQADNLFGRDGEDLLLGGSGLDRLFGGAGDDRLYGGDGHDGHFGEWGNDTMWGGAGNDRFFGGSGADIVDGGSGNDTIYAGSDFDTVIGGTGNDLLFGNFNADTFVFDDNHGHDRIADFDEHNGLERIDLTDLTGFNSFSDVLAASTQSGADVLITTGANSSIRLSQVNISNLDESDFIL